MACAILLFHTFGIHFILEHWLSSILMGIEFTGAEVSGHLCKSLLFLCVVCMPVGYCVARVR